MLYVLINSKIKAGLTNSVGGIVSEFVWVVALGKFANAGQFKAVMLASCLLELAIICAAQIINS